MADTKISEAPSVAAVTAAMEFAVNEGGASKKATADQLRSFFNDDIWFIRADVDRTLPNNTNLNALFNNPANGRATLPTGVYEFEIMLLITTMSGTTGNAQINLLGAGTAAIGSWLWSTQALDNSTPAAQLDDDGAMYQVALTAASAAVAGTGTALRFYGFGTFEVTAAGTIIPSIDLVTAAAAVLQDGSYLKIVRRGDSGFVSAGAWD